MNFTKKYFKIFVGIAGLILAIVVFFFAQKHFVSGLLAGSVKG